MTRRLCRRKSCYFTKVGGPHSHYVQPKAAPPDKCGACGTAWENHLGIATTCAKLTVAREALEGIYVKAYKGRGISDVALMRMARKGMGL